MSLTLNQVIAKISLIANSHKQLNYYNHGDLVDVISEGDLSYPALVTDMVSPSISPLNKEVSFPFTFLFADLANVAENSRDNETEVISDLILIAEDIIAQLKNPIFDEYWEVDEPSGGEVLKEKFRDIVIALKITINIKVRFDTNRCQVPTTYLLDSTPFIYGVSNTEVAANEALLTGALTSDNASVTFSASNQYLWFASPVEKSIWFVDTFNTSTIGGVGDLFKASQIVSFNDVNYYVYATNYATTTTSLMAFKN